MTQNDRGLPETSVDEGTLAILDDTYLYDDNGNVRQIVDGLPGAPGSRTMTYDGLDRLLTVTAGSTQGGNAVFSYDVLDNITRLDQGARTIRHQYAAATNRLASVRNAAGSTLFTVAHDARGNQTSRTTGALVDTFTFDKANRLTASNVGGVAATYRYDGLGRRMQHVEAAVPSYFQYSQAGQLLFSQDGTNRFNHIHLSGSLVAKRGVPYSGGPATTRYQHTDALGSPVAETDEVGALIGRERMTAYGEPADGTWKDGPGFTGHDMDPASKLVYMQQRYYDPVVGRFLSVDPVSTDTHSGESFNRYAYANNNPLTFTDPDGRRACPKGVGGGCVEDEGSETSSAEGALPSADDRKRDSQARIAQSTGRTSDGVSLDLHTPTIVEQGIKVSTDETTSNPMEARCWSCSDGTSGTGGKYNLAALGEGDAPGHAHPGGISGLPGRGDAGLANETGRNYVVSRRGAFVVEKTNGNYRVRQVGGAKLTPDERRSVRGLVRGWNSNSGASNGGETSCGSRSC